MMIKVAVTEHEEKQVGQILLFLQFKDFRVAHKTNCTAKLRINYKIAVTVIVYNGVFSF